MNAPQPISKIDRLRLRDGERCWLCDGKLQFDAVPNSSKAPTIEHLVAKTNGGTNAEDNLVLTHPGCNKQLGAKTLEDKRRMRAKYQAARERTHAARKVRASTSIAEGGRKVAKPLEAPEPTLDGRALQRRLIRWQAGAAAVAGIALLSIGLAAGLLIGS